MKKLFTILNSFMLIFVILPFAYAEGAESSANPDVDIIEDCEIPVIYFDPTNRVLYPNDQTIYTAEEYGNITVNIYGDSGYIIPYRQNYLFTGETIKFYIAVYDEDGAEDIDEVLLRVDDQEVGSCAPNVWQVGAILDSWINDHYNIPYDPDDQEYDSTPPDATDHLFAFYECTLIVQNEWTTQDEVSIVVTDGNLDECAAVPHEVVTVWDDLANFNPSLELEALGGPIDFGSVEPDSTALSNTIYLRNNAEEGSGVVMDMYIAADDYLTDPIDPDAVCPTGNGISYDNFRYYATKGSINSGPDNNAFPALATNTAPFEECVDLQDGEPDEFVQLPSYSGHIQDMCHIINWIPEGSLLTQGSEMSITFKLVVPSVCEGHFTDGQFRFVGRVV